MSTQSVTLSAQAFEHVHAFARAWKIELEGEAADGVVIVDRDALLAVDKQSAAVHGYGKWRPVARDASCLLCREIAEAFA